MSTRKLKTQTLFSNTQNFPYTQVGIKSPQQDAVLVGATAYNGSRYDLISIHIVKVIEHTNGELGITIKESEYVGAGMEVNFIPGTETLLDRDDVVVANFALANPGDDWGLFASFKRE